MTKTLDTLRAALKAAPPTASADRKARDIASAMAAFDAENTASSQESDAAARPSPSRGIGARLLAGGISMFHVLTRRGTLAVTTGLATAGLAMLLVLPPNGLFGPPTGRPEAPETAAVEPAGDPSGGQSQFAEKVQMDETALAPPPARMRAATALESRAPEEAVAPNAGLSQIEGQGESFAHADPNPLKRAAEDPVSTFSVDVDTASWSVIRSSLMAGYLPPPQAVRIEEMVNYFPYDYPAPEGEAPFAASVVLGPTPWNAGTQILHIGLQGALPEIAERPPLNLVFLIDTSGSMQDANKLPLLKQSLRLMLGELRPDDEVAIVTYAGSAGRVLAPTPAGERATILAALDRLEAGGATAGQAGLTQAYAVAEAMADKGEVSRILLATDGDFNVGPSDPDALKTFVSRKRASGTYLSVLGFGRGNLDDALMQALAQNGNGQAAYIDTIAEAQKVLIDQLTGQLFPIAQDVKVQVEFNPAKVAEYRLIGYETRALAREDFNDDRVDAGEIGAGHQVTALYEVTPVGSDAVLTNPLRYGAPEAAATGSEELAFLRLRYKMPGETESRLIERPIESTVTEPGPETRFATAIAGFGQLLRDPGSLGDWSHADAIRLAEGARGEDPFGYRAEAVRLMRLGESLSN